MFELITEYADETSKLLLHKAKAGKLHMEMKDLFSRYTNDIIATCAFGLKVSSIAEPNNRFYLKSQKLTRQSFWQAMKFILLVSAPRLAKMLKIKLFDDDFTNEFRSMILDTMNTRKAHNIHRPDMIHLLMQVRDGSLKHQANEENDSEGFATVEESDIGKRSTDRSWTDDELVAQCLLFFFAGLETVSTALTFAAYELMINPDIQQRLYKEICETNERLDGKHISYEELQRLKYLDQVVCELLRKWTPGVQAERLCVKNYQYESDGKQFVIEKGMSIFIPIYALHHDERYFAEPEKFDPDRFNDVNKVNITPGSYVPFGMGPRNCIGKTITPFLS